MVYYKLRNIILIAFLLLSFISDIVCQIGFQSLNIINDSNPFYSYENPEDIIFIDLDSDDDKDAIILYRRNSSYQQVLTWFENLDGQGNYGLQNAIDYVATSKFSICACDIDNDSDNDIIYSDGTKIFFAENVDGQGNFEKQIIIEWNFEVDTNIKCIDIDNNGSVDLFYKISDNNFSFISYDTELNEFEFQALGYLTNSKISSFTFSDLDSDGKSDLIYVLLNSLEGEYYLVWRKNLSNPELMFGNEQVVYSEDYSDFFLFRSEIYSAKINNDSFPELLLHVNDNGSLLLNFLNLGLPTVFDEPLVINNQPSTVRLVNFVDVDGDTDLDLLSLETELFNTAEGLYLYENINGSFADRVLKVPDKISSFNTEDLTGDTQKEIVIMSGSLPNSDDVVFWFDGIDSSEFRNYISVGIDKISSMTIEDIDNDGIQDVMSSSLYGNNITWYKGSSESGEFENINVVTDDIKGPKGFELVDINNDDNIDIITISQLEGKVFKIINKGAENGFYEPEVLLNYDNVSLIESCDLDFDGDLDIVLGGGNKIVSLTNNGLGDFEVKTVESSLTYVQISSIGYGDVDSDDDLDIFAIWGSHPIWIENIDNQSAFSEPYEFAEVVSTLVPYREIQGADIDQDGKVDIVISYYDGIYWYKNLGDDFFSEPIPLVLDEIVINKLHICDLDSDNDLDLIIGGIYDPEDGSNTHTYISWMENVDGEGVFYGPKKIYSHSQAGFYYSIGDLKSGKVNDDGNLDLIFSTFRPSSQLNNETTSNSIFWIKNEGLFTNKLQGTIKYDAQNNNCASGAQSMSFVTVKSENQFNSQYSITNQDGVFQIFTDTGTYNTFPIIQSTYLSAVPSNLMTDYNSIGNVDIVNFCIDSNLDFHDLSVSLVPLNPPAPGFETEYELIIHNRGNTTSNVKINLEFDNSKLQLLESSVPNYAINNNEIIYDNLSVNSFDVIKIRVKFYVFEPPLSNIDEELEFNLSAIDPGYIDVNLEDNNFELTQIIVGSFDPNDIIVIEGDQISFEDREEYLHYLIRFQNTGTARAVNIEVVNKLSNYLNLETFELLNSSHAVNEITVDSIERELVFSYENINLPDSTTDFEGSNGNIFYKIKPKSIISIGDIIDNYAEIYFDFNAPIVTNVAQTEIIQSTSLPSNVYESVNLLDLFPNPTESYLNLNSVYQIKNISVYNCLGELEIFENISVDNINVKKLTSGVYYCKVNFHNEKSIIKKIIVK